MVNTFKVLLSVFLVGALLIGCSTKTKPAEVKKEESKPQTAEEVLDLAMKNNMENNFEGLSELILPRYFEIFDMTKEKYVQDIKARRGDEKVTGYTIKEVSDYDKDIKKAIVNITSAKEGKNSSGDYVYALVKGSDGNWKVAPDGYIDVYKFDVLANTEEGKLNIIPVKYIKGLGNGVLVIKVVNKSDKEYSFGWANGTNIVVETDKGKFTEHNDAPIKINLGFDDYITVNFKKLEGDIKKIYVTNVNVLKNGLPADFGGGQDLVFYEKK
ncbi:hypothetical protein [Fonticella tunisiensis]|uniref:Lipoprotein n=1 Tax=Fonticella tunisiensis TaxID=1096341 RepID=A0A4R7KAT7_9CLOT|nr:hypothetical protein [Fonticella tunisiensis]TDT51984.1 hypothetical protein EDD71_11515 [Fonticella tunisiensis]